MLNDFSSLPDSSRQGEDAKKERKVRNGRKS
jgi:hypothetical protein